MVTASVKSGAYPPLNRHWKSLCKVLLGGEIGELSDYSEWLYQDNGPRMARPSGVSGKEVVYASSNYAPNSKWASFDEMDLDEKYPPLSINEIKDIDSLIEAVSERAVYCGNMVLGNSQYVEKSTTITDCFYTLHSERVAYSKYVAYSTRGGYSDFVFGCYGFGPVHHSIKVKGGWDATRCFSVSKVDFSSDCYFSHGLSGCHDCLFSFNLKNKRKCIGNLSLSSEKYSSLKAKLVSEMREKLLKDKRLPSIAEIASSAKPDCSSLKRIIVSPGWGAWKGEKKDRSRIEKAFSETTKVVLGKPLSQIDDYSGWLEKCSTIKLDAASSCASNTPLILPDYASFIKYPRDRLLTQEEANFAGERLSLSEQEVSQLSLSSAGSLLSKIAYFSPFWLSGTLKNNIDSPLCIDSSDCYRGILYLLSKCCAFCFCPRSCEYCFGCREGRHVSFCINSHFSTKITRCFEVDSSNNCTGCYYCHNIENVHDSMFCFNTKNKRYAIGNVEVGKEKFLQAKKILLDWIFLQMKKSKSVPLDIYGLAGWKKGAKG